MKNLVVLISIVFFSSSLLGQDFNAGGLNVLYINNNNVGIGESDPSAKLLISKNHSFHNDGTSLVVKNNGTYNGFGLRLESSSTGNNNIGFSVSDVKKGAVGYDVNRGFMGFVNFEYSATDFSLRINSDGSLSFHDGAISESPPQFKVSKAGLVSSKEIQVKTTIADYVFSPEYNMLTIEELEEYILKNKHLPNVQSQRDVDENEGYVKLGSLNISLLEKIEELTLHIIELNRRIKLLEEK